MMAWSRNVADFGASELAAGSGRGSKSPMASIAPITVEAVFVLASRITETGEATYVATNR